MSRFDLSKRTRESRGLRRYARDRPKNNIADSLWRWTQLAVVREGSVAAGDRILPISQDSNAITVSEITRLYVAKKYNQDDLASLRRATSVAALPDSWKEHFRERLQRMKA
jgi:hypothetical protein